MTLPPYTFTGIGAAIFAGLLVWAIRGKQKSAGDDGASVGCAHDSSGYESSGGDGYGDGGGD